MTKTKTKTNKNETFIKKQKLFKKIDIILCDNCELQCAGHGGGYATVEGDCFCFDGTKLACVKKE